MQKLGYTRSASQRDHFLLTPDTFVRAPLPGHDGQLRAIVHAAPAHGAGFTEYTVEFEAGGSMKMGEHQVFLYVLDGGITVGERTLTAGHFAYLPPHRPAFVASESGARVLVIEKGFSRVGRAAGARSRGR